MKKVFLAILFTPMVAFAFINDANDLRIEAGETKTLSGTLTYNRSVVINGTLNITGHNDTPGTGFISLNAPVIHIHGHINGKGKGYRGGASGGFQPSRWSGGGARGGVVVVAAGDGSVASIPERLAASTVSDAASTDESLTDAVALESTTLVTIWMPAGSAAALPLRPGRVLARMMGMRRLLMCVPCMCVGKWVLFVGIQAVPVAGLRGASPRWVRNVEVTVSTWASPSSSKASMKSSLTN